MRNIALILMYNGAAYHGWQVQKTERTVAETLEKGLSMVCGEKIKCVGCGRTDAGVHAEYYVANFRTGSRIPVERPPNRRSRPETTPGTPTRKAWKPPVKQPPPMRPVPRFWRNRSGKWKVAWRR